MKLVFHVWILRVEQVVPNSFQPHLNWHQALGMVLGALEVFFQSLSQSLTWGGSMLQSTLGTEPFSLPCTSPLFFCKERLNQLVLEIPSNLGFRDSLICAHWLFLPKLAPLPWLSTTSAPSR